MIKVPIHFTLILMSTILICPPSWGGNSFSGCFGGKTEQVVPTTEIQQEKRPGIFGNNNAIDWMIQFEARHTRRAKKRMARTMGN